MLASRNHKRVAQLDVTPSHHSGIPRALIYHGGTILCRILPVEIGDDRIVHQFEPALLIIAFRTCPGNIVSDTCDESSAAQFVGGIEALVPVVCVVFPGRQRIGGSRRMRRAAIGVTDFAAAQVAFHNQSGADGL